MIVTCPACAARYLVDPAALRATGRTVRCGRCATTWHQVPPPDAPPPVEPVTPPAMVGGGMPAEPQLSSDIAIDSTLQRFRSQLPALPTPKRRFTRVQLGWMALAAVLVLLVGGLALFREPLVAAWPATGRLYAAIGWPVGPAFRISDLKQSVQQADDKQILTVMGTVANLTQHEITAPKLRLFLRDKSDQVLKTQDFALDKPTLKPAENAPFSVAVTDPPKETASATVDTAPSS